MRDARVLRDQLLSNDDWDAAGEGYAQEHDRYYAVEHTMELWNTQMLMDTGTEADALRARALPLWGEDRTRHPDTFLSGPDHPVNESVRRRFFGEE